jgi:hypothetical protein
MDLTTYLTGMAPLVVLVSAVLTAVTSAVLLWRYRRATLRGMGQASGATELPSKPNGREEAATVRGSPLTITSWQGGTGSPTLAAAETAYRRTTHSLWMAASVYTVGGLAYAMIVATSSMMITGNSSLRRFLWLLVCHAWPIVLTVSLVAAAKCRGV